MTDRRYWSYLCDAPDCCPPDGTPYDPSVSQVAAAAVYAGQVALPDRAALAAQVAPVDGASTRVALRRAGDRAERRLLELLEAAPATDESRRADAARGPAWQRYRAGAAPAPAR